MLQRAPGETSDRADELAQKWLDRYEGNPKAGRQDKDVRGPGKKTLEKLRQTAAHAGTKVAIAKPVNGGRQFMAESGKQPGSRSVGRAGTIEAEAAVEQGPGPVPFTRIEQRERWSADNCAEPHLYMKLLANHVNPADYQLETRDTSGNVAPPCDNCAQWVNEAFHSVVGGNRKYQPGK
jgi:hypothetical protein